MAPEGHPRSKKKKIAILGGGVGAMTAALELTQPDVRDRSDVTVYTLGWRLGGKGASGRNPEIAYRIEEHGLHVWAGLYDNAFRLIRGAYEEMGRPADTPLATWRDAFKPKNTMVLMEEFDGEWTPWVFEPPVNDMLPGDPDARMFLPFWSMIGEGFEFVRDRFHDAGKAQKDSTETEAHFFTRLLGRIAYYILLLFVEIVGMFASGLHQVFRSVYRAVARVTPGFMGQIGHGLVRVAQKVLSACIGALVQFQWKRVRTRMGDTNVRRKWIFLNYAAGLLRGMLKDDLLSRGFDSIDHLDFREWLGQHIVDDTTDGRGITINSPFAMFLYDADFAYAGGDLSKPSFSAGVAVYTILRLGLTWKGAVIWEMQAGMGDTIFTPCYEVLKARGVKFEFFRKVKSLHLTDDRKSIQSVRVARQARLLDSAVEYDPLINVNGLDCWPSHPDWTQLEGGQGYETSGVNFEDWCGPEVDEFELRLGADFDEVVLGISLGALPYICGELIDERKEWKEMVDNVATVRTQAFQLWLKPSAYELGWQRMGRPLLATYDASLLDTWADMTHLLHRESWPAVDGNYPLSIAYFCGPMEDGPMEMSPHGPVQDCNVLSQEDGNRTVFENTVRYLDELVGTIWPDAVAGESFDWNLLVDVNNPSARGRSRLASQWVRGNVQPAERYVMSLPGTTQYRLHPGRSGFANLFLAGDWTWNAFNGGCVEAAAISGMLASNAMCGSPEIDSIVGLKFGHKNWAPEP